MIAAARALLEQDGPQAITLTAVAARAGVTHGNLTYHFGTIAALHTALIEAIIGDLTNAVAEAVTRMREGRSSTRDVVDVVFDAFAARGAGRLIAWLAATGAAHHLAPLNAIVAELVGRLSEGEAGRRAGGTEAIGLMMTAILVPALGQALIGPGLQDALGLADGALRFHVADSHDRLRARLGQAAE